MNGTLHTVDIAVLGGYAVVLIFMGITYYRKSKTSTQFMVADRTIPAWAAGLAVMSAYTSSISYIATPGKAFDDNWHPMIFALCIPPIAFAVNKFVIPYYRKMKMISVYQFLEERLGAYGRIYAAFSFVLYMIGRVAVILYLASLLLYSFVPWNMTFIIVLIGIITIVYTMLGGMEAVIWTDVMQSAIMIIGILFCAGSLTYAVFARPDYLIQEAFDAHKFNLGSLDLSLTSRTVWVMIIYGLTENLRNLIADQNYVQKYASVGTEAEAKRSVWIAMLIYIPLTAVFLYIGTALYAYYSPGGAELGAEITKGDQVFPYYIATQLPIGLKGLIIAAILAAAMSTVDSALNCSATVLLLDFYQRYFNPRVSEKTSVVILRGTSLLWGVLGILFAVLMIRAKSALDVWWQISGIFGGGILGLFLLALFRARLQVWQGLFSVALSIGLITWGTFARNLPESMSWLECTIDPILMGALGTAGLLLTATVFHLINRVNT
ncbi:sodium:solute symporter [candidate division KSB1 bacterium]|nr:sodium/solute symporter [candidate division KSB1 bacterium]RQW03391.1 MAG: sodium:solute symporter [candidate division KSB1 bacterium]